MPIKTLLNCARHGNWLLNITGWKQGRVVERDDNSLIVKSDWLPVGILGIVQLLLSSRLHMGRHQYQYHQPHLVCNHATYS